MFPYILLLYNFEIRNYQNYMHTAIKGKVLTFREQEFSHLNRMADNSKVKMAYKI